MSILVWEKALSESGPERLNGTGSNRKRTWCVTGTASRDAAINAVLTAAPETIATMANESLIRSVADPKQTGPQSYEIDLDYVSQDSQKADENQNDGADEVEWSFAFDTTGGTHKIYFSRSNHSRGEISGSDPAPDLKNGIGWDGKQLQGVDIFVGKLEFTINAFYPASVVTTGFLQNLARITGSTNAGPWLEFDEGSLLFLGATGRGNIPTIAGDRTKPVAIGLKFAYSANQTDIAIGDLTVPSKKGWQYLWCRFKKIENGDSLYPVPVHYYVENIYPSYVFESWLLFGGAP